MPKGTWKCIITSNGETLDRDLNITVLDDLPSPIVLTKSTEKSQLTTSFEVANTSSINDNRTVLFEAIRDIQNTQIQPTETSTPVMSTTMMRSKTTTSEANKNDTIIGNEDSKVQIIVNVQGRKGTSSSHILLEKSGGHPKTFSASDEIQSRYYSLAFSLS